MERRGFFSGILAGFFGAFTALWGRKASAAPPGIAGKGRPPAPRWIEDRQTLTDILATPGRSFALDHALEPGSLMVFLNGILIAQSRAATTGEYKVSMSDDGKVTIEVADLRWQDVLTIRYQTWDGVA